MSQSASQNEMKQQAAEAALAYVKTGIIGVGTGSTVNYFIDALATMKAQIEGTVSSSEASTRRLQSHGIPVFDLNFVETLAVYVDGADESNARLELIKGGGGRLPARRS